MISLSPSVLDKRKLNDIYNIIFSYIYTYCITCMIISLIYLDLG